MICRVCGLDEGRVVENHSERPVACAPCEFLVFMPPSQSEFGQQLDAFTRRQWRAHRRGEEFNEEPPKSQAELECERFAERCALLERGAA